MAPRDQIFKRGAKHPEGNGKIFEHKRNVPADGKSSRKCKNICYIDRSVLIFKIKLEQS